MEDSNNLNKKDPWTILIDVHGFSSDVLYIFSSFLSKHLLKKNDLL